MNHVDPDIQYALQRIGAGLEAKRVAKAREKYADFNVAKLETMMELVADEVANYVPRTHPSFSIVLCLAVMKKIQRSRPRDPEFVSDIEAGWPTGW